MSEALDPDLRDRLLTSPELILGDRDLMRALVGARDGELGENVIDIRGRAMESLESRLDRLEAAHQGVISAAYENQSGTAMIHRAVLSVLEPADFGDFLDNLQGDLAEILRVETLVLIMETAAKEGTPELGGALTVVPPGTVAQALAAGRRSLRGDDIVLRRTADETAPLHGGPVASEALLPLDLGPDRQPALLLLGAESPQRFAPGQGTDLLRFFAQVFRLALLGWLRE